MKHIHPLRIYVVLILTTFNYKLAITETIIDGGYLKTCPRPPSPKHTVISYLGAPRFLANGGYGVDEYQEHDKVYFECSDGYSKVVPSIMYITCGSNGKWFPDVGNVGKCVPNKSFDKCTVDLFRCKSSQECIPKSKLCDCANDCDDGSDEIGCVIRSKYIPASSRGRDANGVITSLGYAQTYPSNYSCMYYIQTLMDYHIEIDFEEFDLPDKVNHRCVDSICIIGLHPKYVSQQRNNYRTIYRNKLGDYTDIKCGNDGFKRVFSNLSYIKINVSLGHLPNSRSYRGFSLTWNVRSKKYFDKILLSTKFVKELKPEPEHKEETVSESIYTILTPIAISSLLPLSLITFLCCHRQLRRRHVNRKARKEASPKDDTGSEQNPPMTLTENNLAKFEHQMRSDNSCERLQSINSNPGCSEHSSKVNEHILAPSSVCRCHSVNCHRKTAYKYNGNRDSYGSHQSESQRYVMSYDVPVRRSPTSTIRYDRDACHSPMSTLRHEKDNQNSPISTLRYENNASSNNHSQRATPELMNYGSSPRLNHSFLHKSRNTRCSKDNLRNSYSSQSGNSCKLCSHHKIHKIDKRAYAVDDYNENLHPVTDYRDEVYVGANECDQEHVVNSDYSTNNRQMSNYYRTHPSCNNSSLDGYYRVTYPVNHRSKESNLDCNDSLSSYYTEKHYKQSIIFLDETYGNEGLVSSLAYSDKRTGDFFIPQTFNSPDKTRGDSLICTH